MSQRYVVVVKPFAVVTAPGKVSTVNEVTAYFQSKHWKIWHWIDNMWLLNDVPDEISPRILWEDLKVQIAVPSLNGVVFSPDTSLFWGNNVAEGWEWMKANWGNADQPPAILNPTIASEKDSVLSKLEENNDR